MLTVRPALTAVAALCAAVTLTGAAAPTPSIRERQRWVLSALNMERAWAVTKGAGVTVAVIDSGVDPNVRELKGKVVSGPNMVSQVVERTAVPPGQHGTAMASLIAGTGAGGGIVGTAPEARVLSLRLTQDAPDRPGNLRDEPGRRDSPLARAIRYAADHGAQVINLSIGVYTPHRSEREALSHALTKGAVVVAAVGNDGKPGRADTPHSSIWSYPAGYTGVIGVGSVGRDGLPAPFATSNLSVLVAAPGVDVPIAVPGGKYGTARGTSASAALVAGVAALVKSRHPKLRPELVARAMATGTHNRPDRGYDDRVGFGTVDAAAVLAKAGELSGYRTSTDVPGTTHFGGGPPQAVGAPGPDPVKMWLYISGILAGLLTFTGVIVVLTRRSEHTSGPT
ncbi:S8 family serine peptidase [Sinosporangium siamense]|uniref:Type VII secretion-associated serine protease n=1 Tax=Sinosporangium siamense TaxID=1367973 RepID=A0A919RG14_9ACTN|nr:S8 family serine peptidase [Sinosporangium siamense]GII93052.1 type VII secretion-associated serine protease [Sinosporangium siamense]